MGFDDIDISENELLRRYPQVLEALLLDHTTHRPIFGPPTTMPTWVSAINGTIRSRPSASRANTGA